MLSPYLPVIKIEFLLREKSKRFRKTCNVYSMFYFDKDENVIYICSTIPIFTQNRFYIEKVVWEETSCEGDL